ncbi:Hydrazine synthase subunit beta [Burkholderiales bacterium]|nr:MAG: YncE family protein [Burkholderiales bacterium]CAG1012281.1 Hydrazine synthase subunit beta [Burkholderiales bacterium]
MSARTEHWVRIVFRASPLRLIVWAALALGGHASAGPYVWVSASVVGDQEQLATIDSAIRTIVGANIAVSRAVSGIAVAPSGQRVYVASLDYRLGNRGVLAIIDARSRSIVGSIEFPFNLGHVAVAPDERRIYATSPTGGPIVVIDAASTTVLAQISGYTGAGVVVAPDGQRFYVADSRESGGVAVFRTATNELLARISVDRYPREIDVSPDGKFLYVTHSQDDRVSVIDTQTSSVVKTIGIGGGSVAAAPDGARVYLTGRELSVVSVIDAVSMNVISTFPVGFGPFSISVTPDSKSVYVAHGSHISVIDAGSLAVSTINGVGGAPLGRFIGPSPTAAALENPQPGSFQSGIGLISGWACAGPIGVSFDGGPPMMVPQGSPRGDTLGECGILSQQAGFGLLTNFNLLGAGVHSAQLWLNGSALGNPVSFTVTRPAGEFLSGASKETVVSDFPTPGKSTTLIWQEAQQNFAIKAVSP